MIDIYKEWQKLNLSEPENWHLIDDFVVRFAPAKDFYIGPIDRNGFKQLYILNSGETKTIMENDLVMADSKDATMFYYETTRIQAPFWIMKRKPGRYEVCETSYRWIGIEIFEEYQDAVEFVKKEIQKTPIMLGKKTMKSTRPTMKELLKYEGTEKSPLILDEPFDSYEMAYKTPFGVRWSDETITLTMEHIEALKGGKCIALDVESEYVVFLRLEGSKEVSDEA